MPATAPSPIRSTPPLSIGGLAQRTGRPVRPIRCHEAQGLVPGALRDATDATAPHRAAAR